MITNHSYIPVQCKTFLEEVCQPNNCYEWGPEEFDHEDDIDYHDNHGVGDLTKRGLDENVKESFATDGCVISQTGLDQEFEVRYATKEEGQITIEFYSILGELASNYAFNKNSFSFNEVIEPLLNTGAYICIVRFGDRIICVKKIMIMR